MGRPRKSEPRDRQFNLCLTASELESLKRRAQDVGMRPVHFGRALLLDPRLPNGTLAAKSETPNNLARLDLRAAGSPRK